MVFSVLVYLFYFILIVAIPIFFQRKKYKYILLSLIFTAQFNVTCILKLGVTFSFFEVALIEVFLVLCIDRLLYGRKLNWRANPISEIFIWFIIFSIISMCIAFLRITLGDLPESKEYTTPPLLRSIMSLNKPIFYLLIIPIGNYLIDKIEYSQYRKYFIKYLALSGIIPAIAVILQWLAIGFIVIHNNPSYSENTLRIVQYYGTRPVGLSNEASIHCFELFFSLIGLVHCKLHNYISSRTFKILYIVFIVSVILSISRTGLVLFIGYTIYAYLRYSNGGGLKKGVIMTVIFSIFLMLMSSLEIGGFNLYDRLISTFDVEADMSTIERYGLAQALVDLAIDKSMIVGVGIYNYFYYLKDYLPDYMSAIHYDYGFPLPSFNFIVQLIAEWGLPIFIFFVIISYRNLKLLRSKIADEWFVSLLIFGISFQVLNFSLPFILMLYPINRKNNDSETYPFLLAERR